MRGGDRRPAGAEGARRGRGPQPDGVRVERHARTTAHLTAAPYRVTAEETLRRWGTDPTRGLTAEQVDRNRGEFGMNTLPVTSDGGAFRRLLRQIHDPLVYVLLAS